jgi:hypothetical protein
VESGKTMCAGARWAYADYLGYNSRALMSQSFLRPECSDAVTLSQTLATKYAHTPAGAAAKAALACPARLSVNLDALFNNTTSGLSAHLSKHVTIPSGFSDDYTAKEIANA